MAAAGRAVLAWTFALCVFPALAQTPAPAAPAFTDAGEVVFVAGVVNVTRPTAASAALRKGDRVEEGDSFVAEADGYAYIRLRDQGLLVLRPQTKLSIDTWRYDPAQPQLSQIHYTLTSGVARHVSGIAAKAARDKFRFNTPVAAIGVRGTDFTVLAEEGLTRVSVRSGGVIVSGLGGACRAEAFGPCEGEGSAELFANAANARDKMLQIRLGDRRPQLVDIGSNAPDRARPPATGEPVAGRSASGQDVLVAEARTGKLEVPEKIVAPITPVGPSTPDQPMAALAVWGRWASVAGLDAPASADDILGGRRISGINQYYLLAANPGSLIEMPNAGVGNFKLASHEGFFIDSVSGKATASTASNGTLSIDFGSSRFQTGLDLKSGDATARIDAQGSVDKSGVFVSDAFGGDSKVSGVVGGTQASQAAYIYQRAISDRLTVTGATSWGK
ncbi:MAG: FecR family protein [Pseudomonadota bacterium]